MLIELFLSRARPKIKGGKNKKQDTYKNINLLYGGRQLVLHAFKVKYFHQDQLKKS